MFFFFKRTPFSILTLLGSFVLILCSTTFTSAYEEKQARKTNKRIWSIIDGKVKFYKSSYSSEKVRESTPKPEQFQTTPQTELENERIPSRQLQNIQYMPINLKKQYLRKEGRKSYATNSKGRLESFHEDPNAIKKFCDTQFSTSFCIRNSESRHKYTGNTPQRRPRKKDHSDRNNFKIKQESKTLVKKLIGQPER